MKIGRTAVGALACLVTSIASAESPKEGRAAEHTMDRLVVTATGWEDRLVETAPAMSVITAEDLERKQVTTVADALRELPGIEVSESGSRGGLIDIFLRGADSDQVLVLVDGIEVNSTTTGGFDFSDLTPENIERIEVVRGWGGTLYGSEAIGGVIQIFTRRGQEPTRATASAAGGNGYTDREVGEASGRSGIFSWSGSASHIRTEGFQDENDDYENTVVSARVAADVIERGEVDWVFRAGTSEFGNVFSNNFLAAPDPNARQERGFLATRGSFGHAPLPGLRYRIGTSYSRDRLEFRDRPDATETSSLDSEFISEVLQLDGQTQLSWWRDRAETIVGLEYERKGGDVESFFSDPVFGSFPTEFDETVEAVSGYALQQIFFVERRLVLTGGARVDDNDRFGNEVSPAGGVSYLCNITDARFRATYAEGFKAPTMNELFFPGFGNPNLDAEKSWEAGGGVDRPFFDDRLLVSASFFHREVEDLILGVPQPSGLLLAGNVGEARIDGVEATLDVHLTRQVRAGGSYTFLDIDAEASGRVRRPKHRGSVRMSAEEEELLQRGDRFTADVRLILVGDRDDFDPEAFFAVRENPAYQRVDVAIAYGFAVGSTWLRRVGFFGRIENLLDIDYDEVLGFDARPINFLAGVRVEL